jgi:hypothetical protein
MAAGRRRPQVCNHFIHLITHIPIYLRSRRVGRLQTHQEFAQPPLVVRSRAFERSSWRVSRPRGARVCIPLGCRESPPAVVMPVALIRSNRSSRNIAQASNAAHACEGRSRACALSCELRPVPIRRMWEDSMPPEKTTVAQRSAVQTDLRCPAAGGGEFRRSPLRDSESALTACSSWERTKRR